MSYFIRLRSVVLVWVVGLVLVGLFIGVSSEVVEKFMEMWFFKSWRGSSSELMWSNFEEF